MSLRFGNDNKGRLVDRYINTSYDIVKIVSDNINAVTSIGIFLDGGGDLAAAQAAPALTAADVTSTNADVVLTNADAVATAADLVSVQSLYDQFDDRYLGSKASDPALDNDGNVLIEGALYWNSVSKDMKAYNGASWVIAYNTFIGINDLSNAVAITIDVNENVGIGVVPDAWTIGSVLQIGASAALVSDATTTFLTNNAYFDGSWKYQAAASASVIEQASVSGHIALRIASAGASPGDAISWTNAMYITDAGELNITNSSLVLDEDTMVSNSAVHLVTQQSVKVYVDTAISSSSVTNGDAHDHVGGDGDPITEEAHTAITAGTTYTYFQMSPSTFGISGSTSYVAVNRLPYSGAYVLDSGFTIQRAGTYRCVWNQRLGLADNGVGSAVIYKNGVLFGTVKTETSGTSQDKSDDLTFAVGDYIELYIKHSSGTTQTYVADFKIQSTVKPFG